MITAVHLVSAIILLLLQNWIGERSYTIGYVKLSLLSDKDEAYSTNFVIKVFGPTVFLILTVAFFQYYHLTRFVVGVINIIYYYLILRLVVIIALERFRLVNWPQFLFQYAMILFFVSLIYNQFITRIDYILPNFSEIKNELWLLVIVFLYQVFNKASEPPKKNDYEPYEMTPVMKKKKRNYILFNYSKFIKKFKDQVEKFTEDPQLQLVIFSILIYENFNRPPVIRLIERIKVKLFGGIATLGIMQVKSKISISDADSLQIQGVKLVQHFDKLKQDAQVNQQEAVMGLYRSIIKLQNPDNDFIRQVLFIAKAVIDSKYCEQRESTFKVFYEEIGIELRFF